MSQDKALTTDKERSVATAKSKSKIKDLRQVDYEGGELTYDADMRMGDLRQLFRAANDGDLDAMMLAYQGIIITWPHDGDPADDEAWDMLRRSEFMALNEALMQDLQDQGEE